MLLAVMQEVEEYEEFDEAEMVDDDDEDPDFTPGKLCDICHLQCRV